MPDPDLDTARRRIEQLEAALMRRTELLEQKQAELANIKASKAYKLVSNAQKLFNRGFPIHTRRRAMVKGAVRSALGSVTWVFDRRRARNGPPAEERHLTEATPVGEYKRWVARHEPNPAALAKQRDTKLPRVVTFSVVVPVYDPPEAFLEALIASVVAQTYPHWELCLANAGGSAGVKTLLDRWAAKEARVKVAHLGENRGIAGNTNAAIELATGDYVSFADHDDALALFALFEVAKAINDDPAADFLYSDEDKFDTVGERCEPFFKPDWSPETLRSRNYVCHLTTLKRTLLTAIGNVRPGFDGAQDYDVVLRASEQAAKIRHVPQVLYHWRMHAASTASNKSSKSYAFDNGKRALVATLRRLTLGGDLMLREKTIESVEFLPADRAGDLFTRP